MIGRGGFGRVYANDAIDSNIAIKFSKSRASCASFATEYKLASGIEIAKRESNFVDPNYKVIRVYADISDVMLPGEEPESSCAFVMQRVHRPTLEFGSDNRLSYQVYLGSDTSVTSPGRGNYLSKADLSALIGPERVKEFAQSAGRLLAFLHYGAKVDAVDMEYILGYVGTDPTALKVYAIDFDRVRPITIYNATTVGQLEWSIASEPYFPYPSDETLYPLFKKGYLSTAAQFQALITAETVLERYEISN